MSTPLRIDWLTVELADTRIDLVRLGWGRADPTYRQMFAARFLPEGTQQEWRSFDELQQRTTSPANAWRFLDEFANIDVTDLAAHVTIPTLILCAAVICSQVSTVAACSIVSPGRTVTTGRCITPSLCDSGR